MAGSAGYEAKVGQIHNYHKWHPMKYRIEMADVNYNTKSAKIQGANS